MVNREKLIAYCLVCSVIQVTISIRISESSTFTSESKDLFADNRRNTSPLHNIHDIAQVQQNNNAIRKKHFQKSRQKRADGDEREDLTLDPIEKSSQTFPLPANEEFDSRTTISEDVSTSPTPANEELDFSTTIPEVVSTSTAPANEQTDSSTTAAEDVSTSTAPANEEFNSSTTTSDDKYISSSPQPIDIMSDENDETVSGIRDTTIEQGIIIPEVDAESVFTTLEVNEQPAPNIADTNIDVIGETVSSTTVPEDVSTTTTPASEESGSSTTVAEDVSTSPTPENEELDSSITISEILSTSNTPTNEESGSSTTVAEDVPTSPTPADEELDSITTISEVVSNSNTAANEEFGSSTTISEDVPTPSTPSPNSADTNIKPTFIVPGVIETSVSSTAVPEDMSTSITPANEESGSSTTVAEDVPTSPTPESEELDSITTISEVVSNSNTAANEEFGSSTTISEDVPTPSTPAPNIADTNIKPTFIVPDIIEKSVSSTIVPEDMSTSTTSASEDLGSSTTISEDVTTSTSPANEDSSTTASKDNYVSSTPEPVAIITAVNIEPAPGTRYTNKEQGIILSEANTDSEPVSITSNGNNQPALSINDGNIESGFTTHDANEESASSTPNANENDIYKTPGQNIESDSVDAKATLDTSDANTKAIFDITDEIDEPTYNFPNDNINVDHYIKSLLKELYRRDIEEMKLFQSPLGKIGQSEKDSVEAIKSYNVHHTDEADALIDSTKSWRFGDISSGNNGESYNIFGNLDGPLVELPMNNNDESDTRKSVYGANPNDDYTNSEDRTLSGILRNLGIQLDLSLYSIFVNDFSDKSFTNDKYKSLVTKIPDFDSVDEEYVEQNDAVQSNDHTQDVLFINNDPPIYPIYDSEGIISC